MKTNTNCVGNLGYVFFPSPELEKVLKDSYTKLARVTSSFSSLTNLDVMDDLLYVKQFKHVCD